MPRTDLTSDIMCSNMSRLFSSAPSASHTASTFGFAVEAVVRSAFSTLLVVCSATVLLFVAAGSPAQAMEDSSAPGQQQHSIASTIQTAPRLSLARRLAPLPALSRHLSVTPTRPCSSNEQCNISKPRSMHQDCASVSTTTVSSAPTATHSRKEDPVPFSTSESYRVLARLKVSGCVVLQKMTTAVAALRDSAINSESPSRSTTRICRRAL
mmetsp:Transcript_56777/g.151600  ORF Transcript_56777/g.151600 Transcript_56777/m.151600 type:complete len:211 (-) Transcript_56777:480-1112(-)